MKIVTLKKAFFLLVLFAAYNPLVAQDLLPVKGKWNAGNQRDYVGAWKESHRRAYLNGLGNSTITGVTAQVGNSGDIPLTLDYLGDEREEFALYRPSMRELIFFSDFTLGTVELTREVGNSGDLVITGDWDGNGKDGFALYRPSTRELWFYQDYNSSTPFALTVVGNTGDIPLAGNWDGVGGDGFVLYRPSTRQAIFFQSYNSAPHLTWQVGNTGDKVIAGDWDGNGTDDIGLFRQNTSTSYTFWLFHTLDAAPTETVNWTDNSFLAADVSTGRRVFYTTYVPHTDADGNYRTVYDPLLSFVPKGIYNPEATAMSQLYDAGYNVAFVWSNNYPVSNQLKSALDLTGNKLKLILHFASPGGIPFVGRFTGTSDLPGIGTADGSRLLYFDTNGDGKPDKELRTGNGGDVPFTGDWDGNGIDAFALYRRSTRQIIYYNFDNAFNETAETTIETGNAGDIPFSGNWDGLNGDSYALYRPSTRQLFFFQNYTSTVPYSSREVGNPEDRVIAGDWNGDGRDGFALYRPSTREFWFYQDINSASPFLMKQVGNPGDLPISGDWDNDGTDGIGVYRVDQLFSRHEFWMYDNISDVTQEATSSIFGNPIIENNPKKYVFGIHTMDEPGGELENTNMEPVWTERYNYLSQVYNTYNSLSSHIFFHADVPYVNDNATRVSWWKKFAALGEATVHDDYPVEFTTASQTNSVARVASTIDMARTTTSESKPNWYIPQAFEELVSDGSQRFFKPTSAQYKAMLYASLTHGATGIINFMYNNPLFPNLKGISPTHYTDLWDAAKLVNTELDVLKPYLLSPTHAADYKIYTLANPTYDTAPVRSVLKYYDGSYVLITVNLTSQPLNAIIQLPTSVAPDNGVVQNLFTGQTFQTLSGAINADYAAFGVNVYKFALPAPNSGRVATASFEETRESTGIPLSVYPNPSSATVSFEVSATSEEGVIMIYDNNSNEVKILTVSPNGNGQTIVWDGIASSGKAVPSGTYYYTLRAGKVTSSGKIYMK